MDPELRHTLDDAQRIVFVCSGNMVRSAFADLYARHIGFPREVASIATTYRNDGLYPETFHALRERGLADGVLRAFRPTHVDDAGHLFDADTVLLAMTHRHLDALRHSPAAGCPAFLLSRVLGREDEIADPVLEGADFGRTFHTVERCVDALARELES